MSSFKGRVLHASGEAVDARLVVTDHALVATPTRGSAVTLPIASLRLEVRGYDKDILAFSERDAPPDSPVVITQDHRILASLSKSPDAQATLAGHLQVRRRLLTRGVLYPAVAITAFLAFTSWFVLNPLVDVALWAIPTSVDRQLGDWASHAAIASAGTEVKTAAVVAPIDAMVRELTSTLPAEPRFEFRTHVVQTDLVNAFALPGGVVVVTTGLLKKAPNQEAIAGVLAHEIAHVTGRHTMRALLKKVGLWAMLAALFGDVSGLSWVALWQGASLAQLGFSRDMESDADEEGIRLLARAGIDPAGLRDFFAFLEAEEARERDSGSESRWANFLRTHPVTRERREAVEELIAEHPVATPKRLSADWSRYAAQVP